jgi:hypothetical protein
MAQDYQPPNSCRLIMIITARRSRRGAVARISTRSPLWRGPGFRLQLPALAACRDLHSGMPSDGSLYRPFTVPWIGPQSLGKGYVMLRAISLITASTLVAMTLIPTEASARRGGAVGVGVGGRGAVVAGGVRRGAYVGRGAYAGRGVYVRRGAVGLGVGAAAVGAGYYYGAPACGYYPQPPCY